MATILATFQNITMDKINIDLKQLSNTHNKHPSQSGLFCNPFGKCVIETQSGSGGDKYDKLVEFGRVAGARSHFPGCNGGRILRRKNLLHVSILYR